MPTFLRCEVEISFFCHGWTKLHKPLCVQPTAQAMNSSRVLFLYIVAIYFNTPRIWSTVSSRFSGITLSAADVIGSGSLSSSESAPLCGGSLSCCAASAAPHTQIPLKNSAPDLLSVPVHGKTVKVLFFLLPFHISFFVSYARSERSWNTHTPAHKQQFFFLPSLFTHANMNFSGVFFSHLQVLSDLKNLRIAQSSRSIPCVYFAVLPNFPSLLAALPKNSLAAGNHWAEQTNTQHQLMRNVNTARCGDESIAEGERECASLLLLSGISQIIQSYYWINTSAVIGRVKFNWIPSWDLMDGAKTHRNCADANKQLNMAIHSLDSYPQHPVCFQGLGTLEFELWANEFNEHFIDRTR